jgi:very-short-patch-repair endonuclease
VIAAFAVKQHGLVTRAQLLRAGVLPHLIEGRVRAGRVRPVHAGVYQVGSVVVPRAREAAALLSCDGAVLSHRTAAALRTMVHEQQATDVVDLTVSPSRHYGRRPGIRTHRSKLAKDEITVLDGLPITTAARTLLDLCSVATPRELERALAVAERERFATRDELTALLNRYPRRPGTRRLRDFIATKAALVFTRSAAEEQLLALIRKAGLPEPEMNVVLHGCEVDCFWRDARLAVEVDGYAYHGSARAFVRDRKRDSALAAAGIQVVRLSWQQLTEEREKTAVQLALALAHAQSRSAGASPRRVR